METLLNVLDHPKAQSISALLIILGLSLIVIITAYALVSSGNFVAGEFQLPAGEGFYTSS